MPVSALLVQLSDPHLLVDDPSRAKQFAAAVEQVARLQPSPNAVIVTGDIADGAEPDAYAHAHAILGQLDVPVHLIPGNHDDRRTMRAGFDSPGSGDDEIRFAFHAGPLRVVACDTVVPGAIAGRLDLRWLADQLDGDPETPTIVALHHPPIVTGFHAMDVHGLPAPIRAEFAALIARSPQVRAVIAGHTHRTTFGAVAGVPVIGAPSTGLQLTLNLAGGDALQINDDPPGFVIHALVDGQIISHVQPVARVPR